MSDEQTDKPVVCIRRHGTTFQGRWPGKRWHGSYPDIYKLCDAVHKDGIPSFVIDFMEDEM